MAASAGIPLLTMERVRAAQNLLRAVVPESRLLKSASLSNKSGASVYLKLESEGPTGSFKVRAAYHAIHIRKQRANGNLRGVVTSSTGNHGAAVASAALTQQVAARIYLPENPNPAKRARIAEFGAEIVEVGKYLEETRQHAAKFAQESGWYNIVDGFDPEMLPGTATIGCEILDRLPNADVIFVPVGDSTLIQGVAFAAKQLRSEIKIVGVQAERAPAYALSFAKGEAISLDSSDTIADGLAVRDTLPQNVREIALLVDDFVLVSDDQMLEAMRHLLIQEHVVAEPAGAATTAAFLKNAGSYTGKKIVLLVTGSNVTEELLLRALQTTSPSQRSEI
jgi:threonine dehydratase